MATKRVALFFCALSLLHGAETRPSGAGSKTSNGIHDAKIVKRSDDVNPLEAVVERLSAEVTQLKARLDAMDHHVAFLAQISSDTAPASGPYKFDHVVFNDGNAYDSALGVFVAPVSGVYTFSLQIFTKGEQRPVVDIMLNNHVISRMALDTHGLTNNGEDSDSTTVTVKLNKGDRVWVQSGAGQFTYHTAVHTYFTGALLYTV